jgi:shikimate dehydrogenase
LAPAGKTVLVLGGDGGTARTATAVLRDLGATLINVSRRGAVNYENVYHHGAAAQIVVNTTPVGMYPHNEATPLELAHFPHLTGAVEVIYNPEKTRFLLAAEKLGVPCRGGLLMLVAQAARARELFDGVKFSPEKIAAVHHHIRNQMRNIVLVGMPGCGKSTVGAALAQALKREFIDTDAVVVARAEMSIPEIFSRWGEADFRRRESEVIAEVGKSAGKVIAVGGGAVLRENNRDALRQNSCVVYLTAPLDALALTGRPLSKSRAEVAKIFAVREPLYSALAEITAPRETAVTEILARFNGNAARI